MGNIEIINRYKEKIVFEEVESHRFKLKSMPYCRVGYSDEKMQTIAFVDPSGGPFISIGSKLDFEHEIVHIDEDRDNNCFWIFTKQPEK